MTKTTSIANHSRLILRPLALGFNHGRAVLMIFLFIMISLASPEKAAAQNLSPPPPEFSPGPPRVDLKMAIVMVLIVTVFFILGFLSVYTRQCAQDRFGGRLGLGFGGPSPSGWTTGARGLEPDVIDTFPTFVYSTVKGHKIGKGALECAVCLNEFEDSETLRLIPNCDHVFHPDCIDAWLISHSTCPVCRANLIPKPGDVHHHTLAEILHPVHNLVGPNHIAVDIEESRPNQEVVNRDEASPEVRLIEQGVNQSAAPRSRSTGFGPRRSRSTGWRLGGMFPRSHSTGRLLGRRGGSHERFTLRLPEDVRNQLVNSTLERAKSTGAGLPRVGSSRRGYRTGSRKDGSSYYERFEPEGRADRWAFAVIPPFVSRTGSVRSMRGTSSDDVAARSKAASKEHEKRPLDRMFVEKDDVVERSSDLVRPGNDV